MTGNVRHENASPSAAALKIKIESRRSLHAHALKSRKRGQSAAEWEAWAQEHATELMRAIGPREFRALVHMVWKLR